MKNLSALREGLVGKAVRQEAKIKDMMTALATTKQRVADVEREIAAEQAKGAPAVDA
jgi:hypothetical protein